MNEMFEFVDERQRAAWSFQVEGKPHNDVLKAIRAMEPVGKKLRGKIFPR